MLNLVDVALVRDPDRVAGFDRYRREGALGSADEEAVGQFGDRGGRWVEVDFLSVDEASQTGTPDFFSM